MSEAAIPEIQGVDPAALAKLLERINTPPAPTPAKPAPIPRRNLPRKVAAVRFTLPGWDGEFELPNRKYLSQAEQRGIVGNNEKVMRQVFGDGIYEAVLDMTDDEVTDFVKAWNEASGVSEGESGAA